MFDSFHRNPHSGCAIFLASAIFLVGVGYLAILPPFEGLDETAHYSSIRQMAAGELPVPGDGFISPDVIEYRRHGPMPYYLPVSHTTRPVTYGPDEIITYARFFQSPELKADFLRRYRAAAARAPYAPTEEFNWEAQHPPLYYALMAPLMKATDSLSFVTQFFVLRLVSFALAFAGLMIAAGATIKYARGPLKNYMLAGFLLYPLIAPMFFAEFGRLGNDSLCLFLLGVVWSLTLAWLQDESRLRYALAIGFVCGLGLLTKAFFLPVLAGLCLFILWRTWCGRDQKRQRSARLKGLGLILLFSLLLGGLWGVVQYAEFGSFFAGLDARALNQQGGLISNLSAKFLPGDFLVALIQIVRTWSWFGTESSVSVAPVLHAPVLLFGVWILINYVREARGQPASSEAWLPAWLLVPFFAGLVWHVLVAQALGSNITPGWYLNFLSPALAAAMGYGLMRMSRNPDSRIFLYPFLIYALVFLAAVLWAQASLYAGCAVKGPKPDNNYQFPNATFCLNRMREVSSNLALLGRPCFAAAAFGGGFLCFASGIYKMRKLLVPDAARRKSRV